MKFSGIVIKGEGYGRKLGFPTANIDAEEFKKQTETVEFGIYAGFVEREKNNVWYRAGIVIGPLDKTGNPKLEAHLLDFTDDLYGEKLTFNLVKFLRPFVEYKSETELKEAIMSDMSTIIRLALPKL